MPYINVKTNVSVSKTAETEIKTDLGQAISIIPGKSEIWLMVGFEPESILYFKGDDSPAAMVEVSVFGHPDSVAFFELTGTICDILNNRLSIDPSRIYIKYSATTNWGWNGMNF